MLIQFGKEIYKMILPVWRRAYAKGELAWDSLSDKTKMIIILSIITAFFLIILGRWIASLPFINNIVSAWGDFKQRVLNRYRSFIKNVQEKSLLLAQIVPHIFFVSILFLLRWFDFNMEYFVSLSTQPVPLQSATTGTVRMLQPIGQYVLFPFAILFPIVASMYRAISSEYFMEEKWIKASMPRIKDDWAGGNERKFASFYEKYYNIFFGAKFPSSSQSNSPPPSPASGSSAHAYVSAAGMTMAVLSNRFLTALAQTQIDYANYWVTLGLFSSLWSLPITGHIISMIFERYHYIPSFFLLWLLNPLTQGGNAVVTLLRPFIRLLQYVPVLNMIVSVPQLQLPQIAAQTPSPAETKDVATNDQKTYENHSLFRYIKMVLDLPVVPSFVRNSVLQALDESGLLLLICTAGVLTPTFITEILSLVVFFLRPALVSLGHSANLRSILQLQQEQIAIFNKNNPAQEQDTAEQRIKMEGLFNLDQANTIRAVQLNTMKRLGIYTCFFALNYMLRSGFQFMSLGAVPLGAQILLGACVYLQSPFFPMSLFQAAIEPAIRRTFIAFHFNTTNIHTAQGFLQQKKPSTWEKLFVANLNDSEGKPLTPTPSISLFGTATSYINSSLVNLPAPTQNKDQVEPLHFIQPQFQMGVSTTVISSKNLIISPIVAAMCLGGGKQLHHNDDGEEEEEEEEEPVQKKVVGKGRQEPKQPSPQQTQQEAQPQPKQSEQQEKHLQQQASPSKPTITTTTSTSSQTAAKPDVKKDSIQQSDAKSENESKTNETSTTANVNQNPEKSTKNQHTTASPEIPAQ